LQAPIPMAAQRVDSTDDVMRTDVLGGLIHEYRRAA
jgi:hypothetical protein